jgi:hypothetical protein
MKVRLLKDGKIYEARYYKDLDVKQRELNNSSCFKPMDIFIDDTIGTMSDCWSYMFDEEVEIIEE